MAGLDDPAAGAPAGGANLLLDLLAARADVRCQVVVGGDAARLGVVVGLVEAQALWLLGGRRGPLDRDRVQRVL
jgi:hypothetical protein